MWIRYIILLAWIGWRYYETKVAVGVAIAVVVVSSDGSASGMSKCKLKWTSFLKGSICRTVSIMIKRFCCNFLKGLHENRFEHCQIVSYQKYKTQKTVLESCAAQQEVLTKVLVHL